MKRFLNPAHLALTLLTGFILALSLTNHLSRFWNRSFPVQILTLGAVTAGVSLFVHIIFWQVIYPNLKEKINSWLVIFLVILASTGFILVYAAPEFTPFPPRQHILTITNSGEKNTAAQGVETALQEVRMPVDEVLPLEKLEQVGQWDLKLGSAPVLVNSDGQTASLTATFTADAHQNVSLLFASNPQSGMVDIILDEQNLRADLYSADENDQIIILRTTPSLFWQITLYAVDSLALTILVCFIFAALVGMLDQPAQSAIKDRSLITALVALPLILWVGLAIPKPADAFGQTALAEKRFYVQKTHAAQKYDMVLLGNSRTLSALSPQAMQEALPGCRILNFGYPRGALNHLIYQAAEKKLDPSSPNKAVVLGISPSSLTFNENEQYLQEQNRSSDYIFTHLNMMPLLQILEPVYGEINDNIRKEFYDDGWRPTWWVKEDPTYAMAEYRQEFSKKQVDPALEQQLFGQTAKWRSQGIQVYSFRVPVPQEMVDIENQVGGFNEAEFVSNFESAGGVWFKVPVEPYHSYDGNHLVKESAVELSKQLAAKIAATYQCK